MAELTDDQIHKIIIGLLAASILLILYHVVFQMKRKEDFATTNAAYVTYAGDAATVTGFPLTPSSIDVQVAEGEMGITKNPWIGQSNISFPSSVKNAI
jgi:hypothetical protein